MEPPRPGHARQAARHVRQAAGHARQELTVAAAKNAGLSSYPPWEAPVRVTRPLLVIAATALLAGAGATPAGAASRQTAPPAWQVGAAVTDTTPPLFDAAADAKAHPTCPAAAFPGHRAFGLQEPYIDRNGNGEYDSGEPYCDANANGRYDGIYDSGGVAHLARTVHDPLHSRALAVSNGTSTVVLASVTEQGIFGNVIDRIRQRVIAARPGVSGVVVSATHNESSPDTVGLYGGTDAGIGASGTSGIDDEYVSFLVDRVSQSLVDAYDAKHAARLRAVETRYGPDLTQRLSINFPTTNDDKTPAATDPVVRVLQAVDASTGATIATMMNLAAHNQEIGHSGDPVVSRALSDDWPGAFSDALDAAVGGHSMFLVGDNGSIEDPETVPLQGGEGTFSQSAATGRALAKLVADALPRAVDVAPGPVAVTRSVFDVPLENGLFAVAETAGVFGDRMAYTGGQPSGRTGKDLRTEVSLVDLGPDLQLLVWPGETFPGLSVGSPWGIEDAACSDRPNPPVATWHAHARWRFQVGLGGDFIGYLIPGWAWSTQPGVAPTTCFNDSNDKDTKGHQHKLETESVGYTAPLLVAQHMTTLLDAAGTDPTAQIRTGRYVLPDGSLSRRPYGAVALWVTDPGSTTLAPGSGTIVALPGVDSFGSVPVSAHGSFMDYDGAAQPASDITTRGMVEPGQGQPKLYVDPYPALTTTALPAAGPAGAAPVVPEAPAVLLLPLAGVAALAVARRRTGRPARTR